ncbi:MAG: hypothetical protein ACNS60_07420 [Candidatus Cyclobacteriaceae bacterium M2_1C_046]
MDQVINILLKQAESHLDRARVELQKPSEDVVPYSICKHANEAVVSFLNSFLLSNGKYLPESKSVKDLVEACRKVDKKFNEVHLSPFYNPAETEHQWMNIDMAMDFYAMAENTRNTVYPLIKKTEMS